VSKSSFTNFKDGDNSEKFVFCFVLVDKSGRITVSGFSDSEYIFSRLMFKKVHTLSFGNVVHDHILGLPSIQLCPRLSKCEQMLIRMKIASNIRLTN
jgi:hypothetical protein